ncbi:MAG: hypothetical protein OXC40_00230, partial [Proteobacteria bacterium]|nr:hypothetical protein [Pseudomonadota bacterium]
MKVLKVCTTSESVSYWSKALLTLTICFGAFVLATSHSLVLAQESTPKKDKTLSHDHAAATDTKNNKDFTLPEGLVWETNNSDPVIASPEAVPGGTYYSHLQDFPVTFRRVGPNSNSGIRSY